MVHIKDIKVILPVDRVINEMPDYTKFGKKSKLDLDPTKIPDLNWVLSTRIHMHTTPATAVSMPSQTVVSEGMFLSMSRTWLIFVRGSRSDN